MMEERAVYSASLIFKTEQGVSLTQQEQSDLNEWLAREDPERILFDRQTMATRLEALEAYDGPGAARNIFRKLGIGRRRVIHPGWLSAAAALLLAGGAMWLYLQRQPATRPQPVASKPTAQPIHPAGNKATLTLSDGHTISLDSVHNGVIAQQGGSRISKGQGQLIYSQASPGAAVAFNTISTPKGGQYRLILPDGSKVWLNAASSLTYPSAFTGGTRAVSLTGEGYFDIAPNKNQPFVVKAGAVDVRVLGTHFDVMAYYDEDHLCTTLLDGKVQVMQGTSFKSLIPGQEALVRAGDPSITVEDADVERAVAWTTGFFEFQNSDIKTIMREIARWYDIEVEYSGVDNAGKYGGRISRNQDLSQVLGFLEGNGIHHYRLEGRTVTVF
jgi:ferric-dicitrate binding protein FerR (iron transport regulator)